jgi:hypothetical protein
MLNNQTSINLAYAYWNKQMQHLCFINMFQMFHLYNMKCSWIHDGSYAHDLQMLNVCVTPGCYRECIDRGERTVGDEGGEPVEASVNWWDTINAE